MEADGHKSRHGCRVEADVILTMFEIKELQHAANRCGLDHDQAEPSTLVVSILEDWLSKNCEGAEIKKTHYEAIEPNQVETVLGMLEQDKEHIRRIDVEAHGSGDRFMFERTKKIKIEFEPEYVSSYEGEGG